MRILIPRMLPGLYEIRNNRVVAHAAGNINPNHMDSSYVLSACSWIMAELIRVFHQSSMEEAQALVEKLSEPILLAVWEQNGQKRILDKTLNLHDQLLLLIGTDSVTVEQLDDWTVYYKPQYLQMTVNTLETEGFVFTTNRQRSCRCRRRVPLKRPKLRHGQRTGLLKSDYPPRPAPSCLYKCQLLRESPVARNQFCADWHIARPASEVANADRSHSDAQHCL